MQHSSQLAQRLHAVAIERMSIADSIARDEILPKFPATAAERMQLGKCLNCERKPEEISIMRRGLCQACYQKTLRILTQNPLLEAELINSGLLAPSGFNPNAIATPLDSLLRAKELKKAADKLTAEVKRKAKK